jgi:hypothetical protein
MATTEDLKQRIKAFAAELHAEIGDVPIPEKGCWLDIVEEMAIEIGDAVATAMVENESQEHAEECEADCPKCGKRGRYRGARERELVTRRGPAMITEPEFYCVGCRKSFFPDDTGTGRRG